MIGEEAGMVEAVVTIANDGVVLRATKNFFEYMDRPFIVYQHDTVPGEFWGRGVCEKGYNPQKALDAEVRSRIDALALIGSPMLGVDITRLPRNPDMESGPGKWLMLRGRPSEVIEPIGFDPNALALTFQQSGDMERWVQMGTGAMDSATPTALNRRNETASGMSQIASGFVKRSKRTMQNIERDFLRPLVTKTLWRYMQFDPERYPDKDVKFIVTGTLGIMAREVENQQLVQLMGFVPPESPAHGVLLAAILDTTTSTRRADIKQAIDALAKAAQPNPEAQKMQQAMQQMQMQQMKLELDKLQAEVYKLQTEAGLKTAQTKHTMVVTDLEDEKVMIQAANASIGAAKARAAMAQVGTAERKVDVEREKARAQRESKNTS